MSDKPFSHPRWHEIPKGIVTGHIEFTEEEKKQIDEECNRLLIEMGYDPNDFSTVD